MEINSSSLDLIQTCLRKSHYTLNRKLKSDGDESSALAFGSSIHKGLETWYSTPRINRKLPKSLEEQALLFANGHSLEDHAEHPSLEAIRQFALTRYEVLSSLPDGDKRSLHNGIKILIEYFKKYWDDPFEVATDEKGPMVERDVQFLMHSDPELEVHYFGTIDVILRNADTGVLLVTDHKTTASLGQEFYNRCKPNFQYTGYVLAAREALGLDTNLFMINGIQVAKTKASFARQTTERTEGDFEELRSAVIHHVRRWVEANRHFEQGAGLALSYPMTAPNPCASYGGCQFIRVCEAPEKLKENIIKSLFKES